MKNKARIEFYKIYDRMCRDYQVLKQLMSCNATEHEYARAKSYWLGEIETGLKAEEYLSNTGGSFREFLEGHNIIDDCGEFVEDEEEDGGNDD